MPDVRYEEGLSKKGIMTSYVIASEGLSSLIVLLSSYVIASEGLSSLIVLLSSVFIQPH